MNLITSKRLITTVALAGVAAVWGMGTPASAIVVTGTGSAAALQAALLGGGGSGIDLSSVVMTVSNHSAGGAISTGTYSNASGTYGIGPGVVISSGNVNHYNDGPSTLPNQTTIYGPLGTVAQEALLDPITGGSFTHFDVTQIDVTFDMLPGFFDVFFNVTFGSEEYPEFIGTSFIDAFGLYVNGTNIAFAGGNPVNINNPLMATVGGTELDGILAGSTGVFGPYVYTYSAPALAVGNSLTFIIADSGDTRYDTTAYISQLGGSAPPSVIPEPVTGSLAGLSLAGLMASALRRRR